MDTLIYVEPAEYINDEMRRILEKGAKEEAPETKKSKSENGETPEKNR